MTKTKKSNKKTSSKNSPAPKSKKVIGRKAKPKSTPPFAAESTQTHATSKEAKKAAWDDYVQRNVELFSKGPILQSPYSLGPQSPFVCCEDIREYLEARAATDKDKMFILQCLMEYYQDRERKEKERKQQASSTWSASPGVYSASAYADAKLPDGIPVPGQGAAK